MGDYPNTTGVWDVDSIGLIQVLRGMNEGHDAAGSSIGAQASFHIGAALNLNMTDEEADQEIEKYRRKIEAGHSGKDCVRGGRDERWRELPPARAKPVGAGRRPQRDRLIFALVNCVLSSALFREFA